MRKIPLQYGFRLPYQISFKDQLTIIEYTKSQGQKAGFNRDVDGVYCEPWYFLSLRTIENRQEVKEQINGPVSDFKFRYSPLCHWKWQETPITQLVKSLVNPILHLYENFEITRVQVIIQKPGVDLPLHRDRTEDKISEQIQAHNLKLALKIPLTEVQDDNGSPHLEIDSQQIKYNAGNSYFTINELDLRHGALAVKHYRGVISVDGHLNLSSLTNERKTELAAV